MPRKIQQRFPQLLNPAAQSATGLRPGSAQGLSVPSANEIRYRLRLRKTQLPIES